MKHFKKYTVRVISSRQAAVFLSGILSGFFIAAPVLSALYMIALRQRTALLGFYKFDAVNYQEETPFLAGRCAYLSGQNVYFLTGSSEFIAKPTGSSVLQHIPEKKSGSIRPIFLGNNGSALARAAFLLERLHTETAVPHNWIIVVNPYYAADGNFKSIQSDLLQNYFPDRQSVLMHRRHHASEAALKLPFISTQLNLPVDTRIEISVFRNTLNRHFGRPLTELLSPSHMEAPHAQLQAAEEPIDPQWGVAESFARKFEKESNLRRLREIPEHLETTWYGESALLLRHHLIARNHRLNVKILLLPINRVFYARIGLDPAREEEKLMRQTRQLLEGSGAEIIYVSELAKKGLYYDSIHFTDRGRAILAAKIAETAQNFSR